MHCQKICTVAVFSLATFLQTVPAFTAPPTEEPKVPTVEPQANGANSAPDPTGGDVSDQITNWGSFAFGVIGTVFGILAFAHAHRNDAITKRIRIEQLLAEAWDLMGGRPGTREITNPTKDRYQLQLAWRKIEEALAVDLSCSKSYRYLGVYYKALGQHREAIESLQKAVSLSKRSQDSAAAYSNMGSVFSDKGETKDARQALEKAIAFDPNNPVPHYNMGLFLQRQEQLADAALEYRQALALDRMFSPACTNLGTVLWKLGDHEGAIESFNHAIELNPDNFRAYNNKGRLFFESGKIDEAIDAYKHSLRIKPDHLPAQENLAEALDAKESEK